MNILRYISIIGLVLIFSSYTVSQVSHNDIEHDDDDNGSYQYYDDDDGKGKGKGGSKGKGGGKGKGSAKDNYLEVNTTSSLSFTLQTPYSIENPQVIRNAFRLKLKTKHNNCSVYAKVSSYTTPRGGNPNDIPLELQWNSDNSPNAYSLIRSPLRLSIVDRRLFAQPKKSQTFQFYYDLRLKALGYKFPAGNYNYTITFTMTQP